MSEVASKQSPAPGALPARAAVVIVGGGIAGLASAWQLAELGVRDVVLLEAESALASHASARNAGIFLPLEESLSAVWLAGRSRDLLDQRLGTSWLSALGVTLLAPHADALDELKYTARRLSVYHQRWGREELANHQPDLRDSVCTEALHLPLGGVIDTGFVLARLRHWAVQGGVHIVTAAPVQTIETSQARGSAGDEAARDRVSGVLLRDGRRIESDRVVLAAGAWAGSLGQAAGSSLTLTPLRRHLVHLTGEGLPGPATPVTWRVDQPVYYRPEAGGILASPCDETPAEPGESVVDPAVLATLAPALVQLAPGFAGSTVVQRSWSCLRTVTTDRELAVGPDARVKGLYWCAGLGGRGMTCGTAAGELLARTMLGLAHPLTRPLSPERFQAQ